MKLFRSLIALALALLIGSVAGAHFVVSAQTPTPDANHHPLVGAWMVDPEANDPSNAPSFDIFMADGTMVNVGDDGVSVGSWQATGPTSAIFSFGGVMEPEGLFLIRGAVDVSADGSTFSGTHAFSIYASDGSLLGAYPGGSAQGTRMAAEGPDQLSDPFPGFQSWTPASPEATPHS